MKLAPQGPDLDACLEWLALKALPRDLADRKKRAAEVLRLLHDQGILHWNHLAEYEGGNAILWKCRS